MIGSFVSLLLMCAMPYWVLCFSVKLKNSVVCLQKQEPSSDQLILI